MSGFKPAQPITYISTGTYTGDGAQNRAIPHSLPIKPKMVMIAVHGSSITGLILEDAILDSIVSSEVAVTAKNSTNFYVGNAGGTADGYNVNLSVYYWVALG